MPEPNDQPPIDEQQTLEQRESLASALAAFAEEMPRGRSRRDLVALVAQLRSDATAEELAASEDRSVAWLPLLSRGAGSHRVLTDLLDEAVREDEGRNQWVRVLLYPLFLLAAAAAVLVFLSVSLVPMFKEMFEDFDLQLPSSTRLVVGISDLILNPVGLALWTAIAVTVAFILFQLFSRWSLPLRIWNGLTSGSSRQVTEMANFTRKLAAALDAGLELPAALRVAGRSEYGSTTGRLAMDLAVETEATNFNWNDSRAARRLPPTVAYALHASADRTPNIPLLRQLANAYSARVRERCDLSSGLFGQFAILGVGLVVGFVIIALFAPLVSLIDWLSG